MLSTKSWMWSSLGLALVVGVCLGVIGDRLLLRPEPAFADPPASGRGAPLWFICEERGTLDIEEEPGYLYPKRFRTVLLERLSTDLDMSSEQRDALQALLEEKRHGAHEFWESTRHTYCDIRDAFRADIRELLGPEQKLRFDRMMAEVDRRQAQKVRQLRAAHAAARRGAEKGE